MEPLDRKGKSPKQPLKDRDQEALRDRLHGAHVLPLGDLVDHVGVVHALRPVEVANVDEVHAWTVSTRRNPGRPCGSGRRRLPIADRTGRVGLKGRARRPVRAGLAQVVQVAVGQPRQPLEAPVAEHPGHAPQHLPRGRPGHPTQGAVNRRQQADVRVRVLAPERLRRRPAPAVLNLPGPAVAPDHPGHLRPRQPRRLPDVRPQQAFRGPPLPVVPEPHLRAPDEVVGRRPVRQLDVQRLAALNEGTNLLQSPYPLGLKCHDHPPMIPNPDPSGSLPAGNPAAVQAHTSLDQQSWHHHAETLGTYARTGQAPLAFLVGAGCSLTSGCPSLKRVDDVLAAIPAQQRGDLSAEFRLSPEETKLQLIPLFQEAAPNLGYYCLASLGRRCKTLVLNLNWDDMVERAAHAQGFFLENR